jgi:hypothetical protein
MNPDSLPAPGRLFFRPALASTIAALMLTACAKKSEPASTEAPPLSASSANAAPQFSPNATAVIDTTAAEATAAELTQVVRKYAAEKQRAPKSLDEIVAAGYLPSLPTAPDGKTFAIDKNLQVHLANK